jgi:hypothetical protein
MSENPEDSATEDRLVLRTSRRTIILMVLICAAFALLGAWLRTSGDPGTRAVGWVMLVLFGVAGALGAWSMLARRVKLIIDSRGIELLRSDVGCILWEDIVGITTGSIASEKFVILALRYPDKYLSRLSRTGRFLARACKGMGFGDYPVPASGLDMPLEEVYWEIDHRWKKALAGHRPTDVEGGT